MLGHYYDNEVGTNQLRWPNRTGYLFRVRVTVIFGSPSLSPTARIRKYN